MLNKNLTIFDNIMFMGDFNIDFKTKMILTLKSLIISVTLLVLQT